MLTLAGEIVPECAQHVQDALDGVLGADGAAAILDLRACTSIDPSTARVVRSSARRARAAGGDLLIVCDSREVLRTLGLGDTGHARSIRPTFAQALAQLRGRSA